MFSVLSQWYKTRFSDPSAVNLALIIIASALFFFYLGDILAPVIVAIVIAYLLEWPVAKMEKMGCRRTVAVAFVLFAFIWITVTLFLGLTPLIWQQASNLSSEIPVIIEKTQTFLLQIPEKYPALISAEQINLMINGIGDQFATSAKTLISASVNSLVTLMALLIYLVLVPLMVFFMLKDKHDLLSQAEWFVPKKRDLAVKVWTEMNSQIGNYIQGKVIEILVVGIATYIAFLFFDLRYAVLLSVAVGLSVLIPYIGAAVVTIPVAIVALFQFGLSPEFGYVMLAYGVIQALDGNVLVPLLFSQAVNLHPVIIIIAVLFFGGLWGFWGVFFAIPLATLVKAVLNAWPSNESQALAKSGKGTRVTKKSC